MRYPLSPGPSAVTSALSISGLPTDKFSFLGFLPKSDGKREDIISKYFELENTLVIYESPNRLFRLLSLVEEIDNTVSVCAIRDMTKSREKVYYGSIDYVVNSLKENRLNENPHGEWVVLLSKKV